MQHVLNSLANFYQMVVHLDILGLHKILPESKFKNLWKAAHFYSGMLPERKTIDLPSVPSVQSFLSVQSFQSVCPMHHISFRALRKVSLEGF